MHATVSDAYNIRLILDVTLVVTYLRVRSLSYRFHIIVCKFFSVCLRLIYA